MATARAWLLSAALAATGCQGFPPVILCGEIPEGGCPKGRGGSCEDELCSALYDCVVGEWRVVETCSPDADAGSGDAGPEDAGSDACTPVTIDHTGETTGCTPELQEPDCPVVAAETCAEHACTTGCVDFFLCTEQGWADVAFCTEEGTIEVF